MIWTEYSNNRRKSLSLRQAKKANNQSNGRLRPKGATKTELGYQP